MGTDSLADDGRMVRTQYDLKQNWVVAGQQAEERRLILQRGSQTSGNSSKNSRKAKEEEAKGELMIHDLLYAKDTERYENNERDAFGPFQQSRGTRLVDHGTISGTSDRQNSSKPLAQKPIGASIQIQREGTSRREVIRLTS